MKTLLSTTALVMALGAPAMTLAQSTDSAASSTTQQQNVKQSGFLSERGQSDLFASNLIGHDVYARSTSGDKASSKGNASMNADEAPSMATMTRADLDEMDNIGQINEIVLSNDGKVRGLVIAVGGFLGMGEQNVAVTMDQVKFAADTDDQSQMYIIVNTGADMLQEAPAYDLAAAWNGATKGDDEKTTRPTARADAEEGQDEADRAAAKVDAEEGQDKTDRSAAKVDAAEGQDKTDHAAAGTDAAEGNDGTRTEDRTAFAAPDMEREGYDRVEARDVSTEMLMEKTVYDVNDNDVGTIEDMILDDQGAISNVVIDFGGFLGIGSSQASLQFKELTILSTEGYEEVRVYVDASKKQIQELPRYMASK